MCLGANKVIEANVVEWRECVRSTCPCSRLGGYDTLSTELLIECYHVNLLLVWKVLWAQSLGIKTGDLGFQCDVTHQCITQRHVSRVHTWLSKPIPIRITLIRMTFHGIDNFWNTNRDYTSDSLSILIMRICIEIGFNCPHHGE